eukprot:scaffold3771_cov110-Skeletonema_dohrnii-CCMP3373.AAC.4
MSRDVRRAFPSVRAASAILADISIRSGTMIYVFGRSSDTLNRPVPEFQQIYSRCRGCVSCWLSFAFAHARLSELRLLIMT